MSTVWRNDIPKEITKIAEDRTDGMVDFYFKRIAGKEILLGMDIHLLARSCYLQGVEDAVNVAVRILP